MKSKEFRKKIIDMSCKMGGVHIAPALSCADIINVIYNDILTIDDKFILSKGHACLSLYSILIDKGHNPDISCGHPDIDVKNGIECTTGSLGHGLPIAVGMALTKKLKSEKGNIYVLMGDSELQEGTTWESLLIASHYKLNNLFVIIDNNKIQALDFIDNVLSLENISRKILSFNCNSIKVNGHDSKNLIKSLNMKKTNRPNVIIADTTKGKGISFMENKPEWHARGLNKEELSIAYKELEE